MPPKDQSLHGSIHFYTPKMHVGFKGEAQTLHPKDEAFYITLCDWDALAWYEAEIKNPSRVINPIDFLTLWRNAGLAVLIQGPRTVQAYFDPDDRARGLGPVGELKGAAALEIWANTDKTQSVVLHASKDYPTDLEIVHDPDLRKHYLQRLMPCPLA